MKAPEQSVRLVSIKEFLYRSTLSRSKIYTMIAAGELPKPIKISPNRVVWPSTVIDAWFASRPDA